jgi:hypothetical protein
LLGEYITTVGEVPLPLAERARCRLHIARWILKYWPKLARDVAFAGERMLTRGRSAANGHARNGNASAPRIEMNELQATALPEENAAAGHA